MCEHCTSGDALVDAAIVEGRIEASARESFVRAYASEPELVVQTLIAATPNVLRAARNYSSGLTDDEDAAYRADAAARLGVPVAEVL